MAGFFMVIGALIMLGAGGCSLFVLGSYGFNDSGLVLMIGGIPFLVGTFIFIMAKWTGIAASQATSLARPTMPPTNPDGQSKKPPVNSFGFTPEDRKED